MRDGEPLFNVVLCEQNDVQDQSIHQNIFSEDYNTSNDISLDSTDIDFDRRHWRLKEKQETLKAIFQVFLAL
jgi:hypothetical protein